MSVTSLLAVAPNVILNPQFVTDIAKHVISFGKVLSFAHTAWILKLNMTMWKYASPVVRMFLSIHAKFVDNALYKARRALGE